MASGRFKPITTIAAGIEFRSRLEAAWFLFFRKLGFTPEYEPEVFQFQARTVNKDGSPWFLGPYLPDFYLPELDCFVEIKPNRATYPVHDQKSIHACYVLGYERSSLTILGMPTNYYAFHGCIRHKGQPYGNLVSVAKCYLNNIDGILVNAYPDEEPAELHFGDFRSEIRHIAEQYRTSHMGMYYELATQSWNETKWHAKH